MAETYEVVDASRTRIGSTECWVVRQQRPDGQYHLSIFPTTTLEWRAAEYDLDYTTEAGLTQIIDMVLHEPFLRDPLEHRATDPAAAKGLTAASTEDVHGLAIGDQAPVTLHNAPDQATALAAHLERIEHAKRTRVRVVSPTPTPVKATSAATRPGRDPLAAIRTDHGITPEGVAAKAAVVEQARQRLALRRTASTRSSASPTPPGGRLFPATTPMWDPSNAARNDADRARAEDGAQ
ncbi:hypothetical protein OG196_31895 [Kitasatospora purpeofusca]|uniref:hypothetical protein n=1 Tax=Kitasatospora purpeofusca TaxID=67352 RepID=UPI002E1603D0|nr:hypothetical protein OG196_31895 [Kitasatospora purpeofusca]